MKSSIFNAVCTARCVLPCLLLVLTGCASTSGDAPVLVALSVDTPESIARSQADLEANGGPVYTSASGRQCRRTLAADGSLMLQAICRDEKGNWSQGRSLESTTPTIVDSSMIQPLSAASTAMRQLAIRSTSTVN